MPLTFKRNLIAAGTLVLITAAAILLWQRNGKVQGQHPLEISRLGHRERQHLHGADPIDRVTNASLPWQERVAAARNLPLDLQDTEMARLLAFLEAPLPESGREQALVSLNEVMEQLRLRGRVTREYAPALAHLIRNPDAEPVVRDYAVQHAVQWLADTGGERSGRAPDSSESALMLDSIGVMFAEPDIEQHTMWGTTLNALRSLAGPAGSPVPAIMAGLQPQIMAIASGRQPALLANHVAALQCLQSLPDQEAASAVARSVAFGSSHTSPLRLPAVATLGEVGTADDTDALARLAASNDPAAYAAKSALNRLTARQSANQK